MAHLHVYGRHGESTAHLELLMVYSDKLSRYANENILAMTLTESFFLNQPNWTKFSTESSISCEPVSWLDSAAIEQRGQFYLSIAKRIWGKDQLDKIFL